MANTKITALTENTARHFNDLLAMVDDPAGSPLTQKIKYVNATGVIVNAQTGTTYTYLTGDYGKIVTHTNGSAIAAGLPQAGSSFPANWFMFVQNRGAGVLTITPTTSTIDGAATLVLNQNEGALIVSDGSNYFTMRGKQASGGGAGGSITTSGYTQNADRLLGRTTASAGAIEEITVGSGLSLSAGSLTATGGGGAFDAMGGIDQFRIMGMNKNPGSGTTTTAIGVTAITPFGDSSNADDDADGAFIRWNTAATTNERAGFEWNNTNLVQTSWLPQIFIKLKTHTSISVCRIWIGVFSTEPTTSDDPASHGLGFRFSTSVPDTNWQAWSNDGSGGGTITDTGVAGATSTDFMFAIKVVSTSSVEFYISTDLGASYSLVATHSTNLPTSTQGMNFWFKIITLENVAKSLKGSYVYIRQR